MNNRIKGILLVFIATACWGSAAVFIRFFPQIDALSLVWVRYLVALFFFGLVALKDYQILIELLKTKSKKWILINALCMIGTTVFLTLSVKTGTIASAVFLLYVLPIFVTTFYRLFFEKKPINSWMSLAIAFCAVGVLSIFLGNLQQKFVIGNVWGIMAGLSWGIQMIVGRKLSQDYPSHLGMFLMHFVGLMLLLPLVNFSSLTTAQNWVMLIAYGLVASVIATFTFYAGIKHVTYSDSSVIALFDPIIAAIAAYLVLLETPSLGIIIGSVFIIMGNLIQLFSENIKTPQLINIKNLSEGPLLGRYLHG